MAEQSVLIIPTEKLDFDPENPRFYRLSNASNIQAIIEEMLDDENVQDLMRSIGKNGYFAGEPLLVVRKPNERFTVIEGNRRLAAVKLLSGEILPPMRRKNSIKEILDDVKKPAPKFLPCLVFSSQKEIIRDLGYRHITGIMGWDSLSKAKYLDQLRVTFYSDLSRSDLLRTMAIDIGSRPDYIAQLLTGLALYEKADKSKFYDLPIESKDIEFSYITTAINYKNIYTWLGLESRTDFEMLNLREDNLKRMFSWMFSKDQQGRTILGETRNLKTLASVVTNEDAVHALEVTGRLSEACLYTGGQESALEQAMDQAAERLRVVWNILPNVKPLNKKHLYQADDLFDNVKSVRNYLRNKLED